MKKECMIYIIEVMLIIFLLFRCIPKNKIREAQVAYLFKLIITWSLGLIVAEFGLIEYPIRLFQYSDKANFLFEFFLLPSISAIFVVNYPGKKSTFDKFRYYFYYCTTLSIIEVLEERYTNVLKYMHWTWYLTWITFFITFYMSIKYNQWFFKKIRIINE